MRTGPGARPVVVSFKKKMIGFHSMFFLLCQRVLSNLSTRLFLAFYFLNSLRSSLLRNGPKLILAAPIILKSFLSEGDFGDWGRVFIVANTLFCQ